jgi:cell division protein FtsL
MTINRVKKNKKWTIFKIGMALYLIAGLFSLVWFRTEVVSLEYELGELNKQKSSLIREQRMVTARRANFYSAKNIEETAVKVLGMKSPDRKNIFYVERTTGVSLYKVSMK